MKIIGVNEILEYLDSKGETYKYQGDESITVTDFSSMKNYKPHTLTWAKTEQNLNHIEIKSSISLLVAQDGISTECPNVIYTKASKRVFFDLIKHFFRQQTGLEIQKMNSYISPGARIGNNVCIGNGCYVTGEAYIEDNVYIGNHVSIEGKTHIGANTRIATGTVIGSVGFGFYRDENGENQRVEHFGGVWIGQDVEIGANCVVNRGTIDDTYIGNNVKIDSLLLIPHNARIEDRCIIIGSMGGSCCIGEDSYIAPYSYIKNQVNVGKNCMVNCGVFLNKDLEDGYVAYKDRKLKVDYRRII